VRAMREAIAEHGIAGATFERVAARAEVSRGLLHYHFGTKERLLIEVLRRDVELRVNAFDRAVAPAKTVDEVIGAMLARFEDLIASEPGVFGLIVELFTAGRQHEDIRRELAAHYQRSRQNLAELLRGKEREGVLSLRFQPDAVASYLIAAADGIAIQMVTDPDGNHDRTLATAVEVTRHLLTND
jgi:AcrR family transcriptional regulator